MARTKAPVDTKAAKLALKDAKAGVALAKKAVQDAQNTFLADFNTAKEYRAAVSDHIAAVRLMNLAQEKVDSIS